MRFIAIIGDIINSRDIQPRQPFQQKFKRHLDRLNVASAHLASPYTITLGDEFQAVYRKADALFKDIFSIMVALQPSQARFAIGIGKISTAINRKEAIGMDGPAFYKARSGIEELREQQRVWGLFAGNHDDKAAEDLRIHHHVFALLSHQMQSWEPNRFKVLLGLLNHKSQSDIAKEIGISAVAVHKNVAAGQLNQTTSYFEALSDLLNRSLKRDE